MAELVDAADLKSADYYNLKGSSPFIPIENFFKKIQRSPPSLLQIERDQSVDRIKAQGAFLSILYPFYLFYGLNLQERSSERA